MLWGEFRFKKLEFDVLQKSQRTKTVFIVLQEEPKAYLKATDNAKI